MSKIIKVLILTLSSLFLVGCGKISKDTRVMEEAKIAFASKEYEKAEGLLELAIDENKDEEAENLYEQVKVFRSVKEKVDYGINNTGDMSNENTIKLLYILFDELQVFNDKKTKSTLVTKELTEYTEWIKIDLTNLKIMFNEYLLEHKVYKAEECLKHIKALEKYKLDVLSDYSFDIKELEKKLEEYKENGGINSSDVNEYTREGVKSILKSRFGEDTSFEIKIYEDYGESTIINGEICLEGEVLWEEGKIKNFYVGSFSGSIYNNKYEKVGELKTFEISELE